MNRSVIDVYDRLVFGRPGVVLATLFVLFGFLGYWVHEFRLDASAESLILEHDNDLRYFREIDSRYGGEEFLVITYAPPHDIFSNEELTRLKQLRDELAALPRVSSVVSILDVPLLRSPPVLLKDIRTNVRTLLSPDVDRELAKREFAESPLFRELIISPDMRSTAVLVNFDRDKKMEAFFSQRMELKEKSYRQDELTSKEEKDLNTLEKQYRRYKDEMKRRRHADIVAIRALVDKYRSHARIFLGGVPLVVDDMISYVRNDIFVFGMGMICFLIITLGTIFRQFRWVVLPVVSCILSVMAMMGILGLMEWEVTVVSSNFISLQLILTMSFAIHVIVRYQEIVRERPQASHREVIRETVHTIFIPCLFSCLTTVAGFASLLVCDILPVVNFGWMMTMGLLVSLLVIFLLFPVVLQFLKKSDTVTVWQIGAPVTSFFAQLTRKGGGWVLGSSVVLAIVTLVGITRLEVENSFINYFKKSTEIYQGLKEIDKDLGGTTPLDVIIRFHDKEKETFAPEPLKDADFDMFPEEEPAGGNSTYWFTTDKVAQVERVHDYLESRSVTGKVLSMATLVKMFRQLQNGHSLDNFELALVFNELPEKFRRILVDPYVSVEKNEARIMVRMKDSMPSLRRDNFLKQLRSDFIDKLGLSEGQFRLAGFMVLYNNMLQSLFRSQIETISLTVVILTFMFWVLFRALKIALIAMVPNLLSAMVVLGAMGLAGVPLDMMTITIVAITLGIAVDNTIHYIHRFRKEIQKDGDYGEAMFRSHGSIGNAMFYTSVIIVLGFSILALSNFIPTILFGLFTALAMIIALVSALTLLPLLIVWARPFGTIIR